jgi:NAD(P)-dependent dehydrogenase (short-subunit alcohol dehydrogenase family)
VSGRLKGQVALITGATRGLGASVALAYAREGAHLLLLATDASKLEEMDDQVRREGGQATLIPYDLSSWMGILQLGNHIHSQYGKLDILVGNAAQNGTLSPVAHGTPEEWERIYRVNALANWALLKACDPLLRASPQGRAIFTTCSPRVLTLPYAEAYWGAYFSSKAALESLVLTYAQEVEKTNVRVNLINPGPLRTHLRSLAFPGEDPLSVRHPDEVAPLFVEMACASYTQHGHVVMG